MIVSSACRAFRAHAKANPGCANTYTPLGWFIAGQQSVGQKLVKMIDSRIKNHGIGYRDNAAINELEELREIVVATCSLIEGSSE